MYTPMYLALIEALQSRVSHLSRLSEPQALACANASRRLKPAARGEDCGRGA